VSFTILDCTYSIDPTSNDFPAGGGYGSITVTPSYQGCEIDWEAYTTASWIKFTSSRFGSGAGTVDYVVAINDGASSRTGTITVNGTSHIVNQVPFLVKPILIAPKNGASFDYGSTINFSWNTVPGATRYFIAIRFSGPSPDPYSENRDAYVNSTSYTLSLNIPVGKWTWAVYALNEYENERIPELKSEIREFYIVYNGGSIL
jgi:hypothetical protein